MEAGQMERSQVWKVEKNIAPSNYSSPWFKGLKVSDGSMSVKLGLMHGITRASTGMHWSKVGPSRPHKAWRKAISSHENIFPKYSYHGRYSRKRRLHVCMRSASCVPLRCFHIIGDAKNQFYQIILALDLIVLKFNSLLSIYIFWYSNAQWPKAKGLMGIRLRMVSSHWGIRVRRELHLSKVGSCGPHLIEEDFPWY